MKYAPFFLIFLCIYLPIFSNPDEEKLDCSTCAGVESYMKRLIVQQGVNPEQANDRVLALRTVSDSAQRVSSFWVARFQMRVMMDLSAQQARESQKD